MDHFIVINLRLYNYTLLSISEDFEEIRGWDTNKLNDFLREQGLQQLIEQKLFFPVRYYIQTVQLLQLFQHENRLDYGTHFLTDALNASINLDERIRKSKKPIVRPSTIASEGTTTDRFLETMEAFNK